MEARRHKRLARRGADRDGAAGSRQRGADRDGAARIVTARRGS
jgi:hypothetical protein